MWLTNKHLLPHHPSPAQEKTQMVQYYSCDCKYHAGPKRKCLWGEQDVMPGHRRIVLPVFYFVLPELLVLYGAQGVVACLAGKLHAARLH